MKIIQGYRANSQALGSTALGERHEASKLQAPAHGIVVYCIVYCIALHCIVLYTIY